MSGEINLDAQLNYMESKLFHDRAIMSLSTLSLFEAIYKSLKELKELRGAKG